MSGRRIAMLSGPRNISTTMMRAFECRPDTTVVDEPLYGCYLKASGALHPMREQVLSSQSSEWASVLHELDSRARRPGTISFEKHISYHFEYCPTLDWLADTQVFHLIRDPQRMIASFSAKHLDLEPIVASYRIQRQIFEQHPSPVIDAGDILQDPKKALSALCAQLNIPFYESMLTWPAGARTTDGVWASHWYDAVRNSSGFRPYEEPALRLPPHLKQVADECMPDFSFLHERRIRL